MDFNSYIVQDTKTSLSMPLVYLPQKLKRSKDFKRFAFTLAETLITLTIIGVIAALTVPNLLNKYTKHTYVVGLKKAYSQLQNAVKMIPITEGCSAGDFDCAGLFEENGKATNIDGMDFEGRSNIKLAYLFSKQFKITKFCIEPAKCSFDMNKIYYSDVSESGFTTQDGMQFVYGAASSFGVDINGDKGPNKRGRDIFYFDIAKEDKNGIPKGMLMPLGSMAFSMYWSGNNSYYWKDNNLCETENLGAYGEYCTGRVLEEDAMNY